MYILNNFYLIKAILYLTFVFIIDSKNSIQFCFCTERNIIEVTVSNKNTKYIKKPALYVLKSIKIRRI